MSWRRPFLQYQLSKEQKSKFFSGDHCLGGNWADVRAEMICHCQNAVVVFINWEWSDEVYGHTVATFIRNGKGVEGPGQFSCGGFIAKALCT
jgi:hypothetical protein